MTTHDSAGGVPMAALLEHRDWVRALARSLVSDRDRADDIEQETWRMALERPPRHGQSLRGWLRVVVRNAARKAWRRDESVARTEGGAPERPPVPSPVDLVAQAEVQHQLVRAVLELDEPYRSAILYRFFEGLPPREIAARVNVPVETVRTRVKRGVARLRERMDAELGDDRGAWALLVFGSVPDAVASGPGALTSSAGSSVAASTAVWGGAVVASASKCLAAAAVVLLALGAAWFMQQSDDAPPPQTASVDAAEFSGDGQRRPRNDDATAESAAASDVDVPSASPLPPPVDLDSCDRERDLHGIVQDAGGAPVAGARVVVLRRPPWGQTLNQSPSLTGPEREHESTLSASDGTFKLRLPIRDGVGLRVDAAGFAIWESRRRQAGERTVVRLTPAVALTVTVHGADGNPAPNVPVRVTVQSSEGDGPRHAARTDEAGTAVFERLPRDAKGEATIASHALAILQKPFELTGTDAHTLELVLPAHRTLRGVVVDETTTAGIAGARVSTGLADPVAADQFGRFEVAVYEGARIEAVAEGYARQTISVPESGDARLTLPKSIGVTGRVVDVEGNPISGADVALLGTERSMSSSHGGGLTGEDGRYAIEGLTREANHLLRIESADHALSYTRVHLSAGAGRSQFDFGDSVLLEPRMLRGVVVGADDEPLPRIALRIRGPFQRGIHLRRATDDLGRFAFARLPPGKYEITARQPGLERRFHVVVPDAEDGELVTLKLVPEDPAEKRSIPVKASVLDEAGNPVAGVRVSFTYAANGGTAYAPTDAQGALVTQAEYEPVMVSAALSKEQAKRWLRPFRWLRPGERDVTLQLQPGEPIAGQVFDGAGKPIAAWVVAMDGVRQVAAATADDQGRFAFAVPAGSKLSVLARPTNFTGTPSRRMAVVHDVESGNQDVKLRIGNEPEQRTLSVEVVDEAGTPIERVALQASFIGEDHSRPIMAMTDASGVAKLAGLPRAPVTIVAFINTPGSTPETYSPMPQRVASGTDQVRFVMTKPRILKGRVVDTSGDPVGGAHVSFNQFGAFCVTTADADGHFELRVPQHSILPAPINASPIPFDPKNVRSGYDLVEKEDREYTIVLRAVPSR